MIQNLRRISVIEGVSYLLLLVGTALKRLEVTEIGVTVMGPIHGVLFLVFAGMFLRDYRAIGWRFWKAVSAIFIGSLPFGAFYIEQSWLAPLKASR